ncbi:Gfo/Idh/MocA family protein [Arthrobacter ramosus]|uniref:Gfo/Idh/MocA family protein n=1 Tax=Arthrobacter ramosus TaxID=1672 RepID=A0ABV5XW05_ARTRM|nr:Gfo/Idh/MocA family oxidoreductase [Arthrobacter ramosus]
MPWNVGLIGAGPGVAALHLATLGRVDQIFRIVHISDAGSGRAQSLAERYGARWSQGDEALLADPEVEVVAVCSPPSEHARQILAAVAAGKRAVMCEKPLATSRLEASAVIAACRAAGTALLVGTNHLFDTAWGRAKHHLVAFEGRAQTVSVTLALPPNDRYHRLVAEVGPYLPSHRGRPDLSDPVIAADVLRQLVTGLAVHDLPALRDIAPVLEKVEYARLVPPVGYVVGYRASGVLVQLVATMIPHGPDALWRMSIATTEDRIEVDFPPAFVHAGSAVIRVRTADGRWTTYRRDLEDGYISEWRAFAALIEGVAPTEYDDLLADAYYAIDIADAAVSRLRAEAPR